ncbi:hypothetical protein JOC86_000966 [Bacillus pakistanensis]|uniref:Z-ring formation inhibitor MciZ n=1 Tax=Rossellomorea pakistanensis TaxID=992288 RepID=A0ABS2N992_9BACI|nr:Z-ring formation inhibitor MciZ [Bacillus pakistanensis]MBM7584429.1 hypothetical protein [Bacillus pakistanensis]
MKIILHEKRIILVGKAWEIREKLKQYGQQYEHVAEWIHATKSS